MRALMPPKTIVPGATRSMRRAWPKRFTGCDEHTQVLRALLARRRPRPGMSRPARQSTMPPFRNCGKLRVQIEGWEWVYELPRRERSLGTHGTSLDEEIELSDPGLSWDGDRAVRGTPCCKTKQQ